MDNPLLKYSAKDYFFKAALCHFIVDELNAKVKSPSVLVLWCTSSVRTALWYSVILDTTLVILDSSKTKPGTLQIVPVVMLWYGPSYDRVSVAEAVLLKFPGIHVPFGSSALKKLRSWEGDGAGRITSFLLNLGMGFEWGLGRKWKATWKVRDERQRLGSQCLDLGEQKERFPQPWWAGCFTWNLNSVKKELLSSVHGNTPGMWVFKN